MVAHTWNHNTQEIEEESYEFEAILGYICLE